MKKKHKKIRAFIKWFCIAGGICIVIATRIQGIHLTEGELFIKYWFEYILAIVFVIGGYCA